MSFGEDLRQHREQLGIGLETISDRTKISLSQLQALERDDVAALPGGVFKRGIVQGYCRVLGLDETPWLQRFQTEFQGEEANWTQFAEAVKRSRAPADTGHGKRWFGVLVMFAALLAIAWAAWKFVIHPRMPAVHGDARTSMGMTRPSATIDSL